MTFTETKLKGAFVIRREKKEDERGFFARTFCQKEFDAHGLNTRIAQSNVSYNKSKGTFRGMHFQMPPFEEDKTVTRIQGSLLDYIVDLRETSATYKQWLAIELSAENGLALYVPKSFAHGFLTLTDDTVVHYQMSEFYRPEYAHGFRVNDPAFNIELPFPISIISERDMKYSDLFVPAHQ
jgi:dTDP-4-dehydrorhamnose 3,5-epimerase